MNPLIRRFQSQSYVQLHGEMPAGASVFKDNKTLIKDIIEVINQPFEVLCFQKAVLISHKMISVGNSEWTDVFRIQLESLDYDKLLSKSDLIDNIILNHVLKVVILGYDLTILNPITRRRQDSKDIRNMLGRVKNSLELNISRIPIENRENVRKFLNQIVDVPSKSDKE